MNMKNPTIIRYIIAMLEIETIFRAITNIVETIDIIKPKTGEKANIKTDRAITPIKINIPNDPKLWAKLTILLQAKLLINCLGDAFT